MKVLRNMCGTNPLSHVNHLEKAQTLEERLSHRCVGSKVPWIITTLISTCLALFLFVIRTNPNCPSSSPVKDTFETGFSTDLASALHLISVEQVMFTGSPDFEDKRKENVPEEPVRYVGKPTDEVDAAWDKLTEGRYFLLSEKEAFETWGEEAVEHWDDDWGGYLVGFDMFHTLHCLDHIRKAFYPDRYKAANIVSGIIHRDHCVNHLRQMIQCYGDITPIPTKYYPGPTRNYLDSDRLHTCRNFQAIRNWTTQRNNGSLAVEPQLKGERLRHGGPIPQRDYKASAEKTRSEKRWLASLLASERASGPLLKFFERHGSW